MSILKIKKEISKLLNKEANLNNNFSYPDELFLVTDSKLFLTGLSRSFEYTPKVVLGYILQ